jgi:macrolide-specific efflux system membrane fusion protein
MTWMTFKWFKGWRLAAILVVLAAGAYGVKRAYFTPPPSPQVITAKVVADELEDTVLASGTMLAAREVNVGAQATGQIKRIFVDLGQRVKKGELIAEIDATTQTNALRNAEAQIALLQAQRQSKQATLKQARLNLGRKQALIQQDAGSRADVDDAEATVATTTADLAALDAQIKQATISLDTARVNLGYTRMTSPIDGTVIAIVLEEGRSVNAAQSAPTVIKLAQLDRILVRAQISEADVVRVKTGLPAYFTILGDPGNRFETTLRGIEPVPEVDQTDAKVTTATATTTAIYYNGLFDVPNPDGKLRPLMTAQVNIVLNKVDKALLIPASALGKRDRKTKLYSVNVLETHGEVKTVVPRQVKIGLNNRVQAQVLEGLKEGEEVVVGEASSASGGGARRSPGMF